MEDKHKNYLDKVIEFIVRDTKIDFKGKKIFLPFRLRHLSHPSTIGVSSFLLLLDLCFLSFSSYCKEVYGLTDQEMEYVWKEYKSIIKDKINEG
jgi:hypothetical protein